ncbi:UNVERIFIED_CONTAM: hypothetical protein FKN15_000928 [Acipenser sinensis]
MFRALWGSSVQSNNCTPTCEKLRRIKLKEIFETPVEISLVLELVTGGELFDRIVEKGYYSERDAADAVKQILAAVAFYAGPDPGLGYPGHNPAQYETTYLGQIWVNPGPRDPPQDVGRHALTRVE